MNLFQFTDYRSAMRSRLDSRGRGARAELAKAVRVHPTVLSQVFAGTRDLTEEQALDACEFLSLSVAEASYLRLLVRLARAGTPRLRAHLRAEMQECRKTALTLSVRITTEKALDDSGRAIFYSSWLYSAIRLYCSTAPSGRRVREICEKFSLRPARANEVIAFLTRTGLCVREGENIQMGSQSTFVERGSPFLSKHHANWRVRAMAAFENLSDHELMFTGPFSVSRADFAELRERLAQVVAEFSKMVKDSPAEEVACLNIDLFKVEA